MPIGKIPKHLSLPNKSCSAGKTVRKKTAIGRFIRVVPISFSSTFVDSQCATTCSLMCLAGVACCSTGQLCWIAGVAGLIPHQASASCAVAQCPIFIHIRASNITFQSFSASPKNIEMSSTTILEVFLVWVGGKCCRWFMSS